MKLIHNLFVFIILVSQSFKENKNYFKVDYETIKNTIKANQKEYKSRYLKASSSLEKTAIIEEARNYFTKSITTEIIPNWYGTTWSFEGHTENPKKGKIACGYFVSTTLAHSGLNINRYKLAQMSPEVECKRIQIENEIDKLENKTISEINSYLQKNKKDGLYFVGLDYHVGYLLKEKNNVYFIHSNYINNEGVIKEKISESQAFKSKKYFIADITYNNMLIKKWILNEKIDVY